MAGQLIEDALKLAFMQGMEARHAMEPGLPPLDDETKAEAWAKWYRGMEIETMKNLHRPIAIAALICAILSPFVPEFPLLLVAVVLLALDRVI